MDPPLEVGESIGDDMRENEPTIQHGRKRQMAGAVGLLLAGGIAGGVLAAVNPASAADTAISTPVAAATAPADRGRSVRDGETALTGTDQATARAAALKAVPGGTVDRLETDADGATYEAHMTKADGTRVTVKFDKSFKVTEVQDGMGSGGPGGPGGPGRHDRGSAPTSSRGSI
jgi:hypothetical protein